MNETGFVSYEWNDDGPVYGPNGLLELDPDNEGCYKYDADGYYENDGTRPVFSTCKNNCPGGEWSNN